MKDNGSLNSVLRTARASGHSVNSPDLSLVADGNLMAWAVGQCRVHEET